MDVKLHANATTTPRVRAYIQSADRPVAALARELGVSEVTVRRWRGRDSVLDRSHARVNRGISLSAIEEHLVRELRSEVGLGLDDIVEVMQRCVRADLSRSAIYRCLRRHGVAGRTPQQSQSAGTFAPQPFGYVHVDLKHLPRLKGVAAYVFVAIERTTRFAHVEIVTRRDASTIARCLERFIAAFGHPIHTILTDNGSEFTDRFAVDMKGKPAGKPSGNHPFDRLCGQNHIQHRLTRPFHPQTNGMVERFNRRIQDAITSAPAASTNGGKNRFETPTTRADFILAFVKAYNRTRLRCLNYTAPIQALNNLTKDNTFAGTTPVVG